MSSPMTSHGRAKRQGRSPVHGWSLLGLHTSDRTTAAMTTYSRWLIRTCRYPNFRAVCPIFCTRRCGCNGRSGGRDKGLSLLFILRWLQRVYRIVDGGAVQNGLAGICLYACVQERLSSWCLLLVYFGRQESWR